MNTRFVVKSLRLWTCLLAAGFCLPVSKSKSDEPVQSAPSGIDPMRGDKPGQVRDDNGLKMKLVWCPPGQFKMGSPESEANRGDRRNQVEVTLTHGIWLGKYEVTQSEWKQVMATEPWTDKSLKEVEEDADPKEGDHYPATFVNWDEAMEFCRKLTDRERQAGRIPGGWEYTLPTDAQWEYACRAGTKTRFHFGDDQSKLSEYAWFGGNAGVAREDYAHQVGQKKPNPWGLYDMHGNVDEWCRDWYREAVLGGRDPEEKGRGGQSKCRVSRGGNWNGAAVFCQSAKRWGDGDAARVSTLGFRVALSPSGR